MYLETLDQKTQQNSKSKQRGYKAKSAEEVTIPDAWGLNDLQRSFINSMIDKQAK